MASVVVCDQVTSPVPRLAVDGGRPTAAVIGAGLAGASCARWLADAGWSVQVIDKSRGLGGRLATRRMPWVDTDGALHELGFDHGATGFSARSAVFRGLLEQGQTDGWMLRWWPRRAAGAGCSARAHDEWLPLPGMPALCQHLLTELPVRQGCRVDRIERIAGRWRVSCDGQIVASGIQQLVLAMPPAQAAALLAESRPGWAEALGRFPMQPCWTLMGLSDDVPVPWDRWDRSGGDAGPLLRVVRNDRKPGRPAPPGTASWVVQAGAEWSAQHLEDDAEAVAAALRTALQSLLGATLPLRWRHSVPHRWRYALPAPSAAAQIDTPGRAECWHDATQGLGLAGDFLAGSGAEAAFLSGRALAIALQRWHTAQTELRARQAP